ncbi:hypothetical protein FBU30_010001 [Linnemannia zychae]|nr:hypothetical protein FBU30_010001 [Linnemannia zychae]
MSNLTYQHRQYQLRQQKQIQQQELSRRQIQGQSPPRSSPDESLDDSRSARFSISSNDGNRYPVRSLVHPIPPHLHYRHREGSLSPPISSSSTKAVATAAVPASTENLDLEVSADRPLISSHGLPAATSKSTSSTGTISMAATKAHTPLDDLPSSSTSLPFSGRDREYDLDARTSLYPLDNPRNAYAYLRPHYYHNAYRRHSAQSSQSHPYPIDPYYPYRSHNLARSGSFDEGDPEYHYPRSYWDSQYGDPLPSYYPPRYSAYYPPYFDTPLPRLGPVTAPLLSEPSHHLEDINSYHAVLSRGEGRTPSRPSSNEDGEERRQSKERGEQAHEESQATSSSRFHNLRFKFGTEMPSTIDLKSAIESCDILCRFALHYENQMSNSNSTSQSTVEGSMLGLNQDERANLQRIRNMNTTMLIGIQKAEKMNNPSLASSTSADHTSESLEAGRAMEEDVTGNNIEEDFPEFGQGQPWNIMVLELARAATSIFQLAIRIKAWVNMTPEERELDEEINMIRGKRCLLMDSTLAIPIVDQHGNLQKDWAIVPAAASTSKTFYQRQRDLEQQRQSQAVGLSKQLKNGLQVHQIGSTAAKHELGMSVDSNGTMIDHEGPGESTFKIPRRNSGTGGVSSTAASRHDLSKLGVEGRSDIQMSSSLTSNISSIGTSGKGGRIYRPSDPVTRNSKYSDVPHQKYRKRAKRSQAPGRCRSCNSSDTPEWRRGPDGARTLCNACGLHYAKLLKRQNEQGQQSASRIAFVPHSANSATSTSTTTIAAHAATITTTPAPTSPVATTTTAIASSSSEVVTTTLQPLSAPITAPAPVPAPAPTLAATATTEVTVNKDKTVNQSSSGMNSTFPLISFPFKRQHGFGKTKTSLSSSTSTATPTTATSTATVTTTTSLTFSKSSEGRTMTDHQVVPMYDGQNPVSNDLSAIRKSTHHNGRRNGPVSNTSQYQMLQRQQLQCQQMEFQKPNTNDQDNMQDVTMNHS